MSKTNSTTSSTQQLQKDEDKNTTTTTTNTNLESSIVSLDTSNPFKYQMADRYVLFPIKNEQIWKMYKKHEASFWTVEEVDCSGDRKEFEKLSQDEQHFLCGVLAFFAASDGIVLENLAVRFFNEIEMPEVRCFYGFQIAMENIHSEMYSLLIDNLVQGKEKQNKLFQAVTHFPAIRAKADWAIKWMQDKEKTFAHRLAAFACVEGIFFSGSFCAIFWLKKSGKNIPGVCFSNELIARDEALHVEFAVLLYSLLSAEHRLSPSVVNDLIKDAVNVEKQFIIESLPVDLIGMNKGLMSEYIEYVADRICVQLGYEKIFNTPNPFPWMIYMSLSEKSNFFEKRVASYALANVNINQNATRSVTQDMFVQLEDF